MAVEYGEEFLIGLVPSREGESGCDDVPEDKMPTWAQLIFLLNNQDINTFEIILVGCGMYNSDENPQSENGVGGWSGVRNKSTVLRIPLGGTPGIPAVPILEALEHTQDWSYTGEYASVLSNGATSAVGDIVGIVIRKIN